jgi:hypothetical protein
MLVRRVDAALGDRVRPQAGDVFSCNADTAAARRDDPHDRVHRRRLTRAVAAEQRHDLTPLDVQREVEQDVRLAVKRGDGVDLEQAAHASSAPPR